MADSTDLHRILPRPADRHYDPATFLGLVGAFFLTILAIFAGGTPQSFLNLPSVLIVLGGTLLVTMACFSPAEARQSGQVLLSALTTPGRTPEDIAKRMIQLSEFVRSENLLSLQGGAMQRLKHEPVLHEAMGLVIDSAPVEEIDEVLRRAINAITERHNNTAGMLRKAAEIAPAMGLIGTLIGLIQMLGHMEDPSAIGPPMALALLTTFYGIVLATMLFSPLAAKLERNAREEFLINRIFRISVLSIARRENPRRLEMLLNSVLPPDKRVHYFE